MKHKQRIARATEKHATLLYKTGKKTIEVTQDLSHKTNVMLKDGLDNQGYRQGNLHGCHLPCTQGIPGGCSRCRIRHHHHQAKTDQMECSEIQQ